jgi:hypothetical protein
LTAIAQAPNAGPSNGPAPAHDLPRILAFFLGLTVTGLAAGTAFTAGHTGWKFWGTFVWSLALLASGMSLGFLFGIPKVLQNAGAAAALGGGAATGGSPVSGTAPPATASEAVTSGYRQLVNTNLEEISDWLTKIIVGVGLIQLKSVPDRLWQFGSMISGSLGTGVPPGFGVALTLFFAPSGFLFGYLVTRLYVQAAFARADRQAETDASRGQAELLQGQSEVSRAVSDKLVAAAATATGAATPPRSTPGTTADLQPLADRYLQVDEPDWAMRVRVKSDLAEAIGALIIERGVPRDAVAGSPHEGCLIGLAAAVLHSPESDDARRLLAASTNAQRLHVQYYFVMAFRLLLERGLMTDGERALLKAVLTKFEHRADASLRRAIAALRQQLG